VTVPSYAVDFRGHPACPCQATWLPAFEAEAQRRGILSGPLPLSQLIGGAPQSGGTHTSGGADDTYPLGGVDVAAYVALSRDMGADATWHRPFNWDGRNGVEHVHRVLTGCPHNDPARYQITAVRDGFNGLGHLGDGAPDDGPPLSGRTWRQGITWAKEQIVTEDEVRAIVRAELARPGALDNAKVDVGAKARMRLSEVLKRLRAKRSGGER
jgi:hypothetical protein